MDPQGLPDFFRNFQNIFGMGMMGFGVLMTLCTALPFVAIAVFLFYRARKAGGEAQASQTWPSVIGTVVSAVVETSASSDGHGGSSTHHTPCVAYEYEVLGHRYRSDRLSFGASMNVGGYAGAQAVVDRYVPGNQVRVYYNPNQPGEAVLERTAPANSVLRWVGIFILVMLAIIVCVTLIGVALPLFFVNNLLNNLMNNLPR